MIRLSRVKYWHEVRIGQESREVDDYLITGDSELLALGKVSDTEIVSPRSFWEKMKSV